AVFAHGVDDGGAREDFRGGKSVTQSWEAEVVVGMGVGDEDGGECLARGADHGDEVFGVALDEAVVDEDGFVAAFDEDGVGGESARLGDEGFEFETAGRVGQGESPANGIMNQSTWWA